MAACKKFLQQVCRLVGKEMQLADLSQCWETTQSRGGHDHNVLSSVGICLIHRPGDQVR